MIPMAHMVFCFVEFMLGIDRIYAELMMQMCQKRKQMLYSINGLSMSTGIAGSSSWIIKYTVDHDNKIVSNVLRGETRY